MPFCADPVATAASGGNRVRRHPRARHYVMTPPTFFAVSYEINPWMDTAVPVDAAVAMAQWKQLYDIYRQLGHTVDVVEPVDGLPDMVYAANGGLIIDQTAIVTRFKYPQRAGEADAYRQWMVANGYRPVSTRHVNEGQGDLLLADGKLLGGTGFRTDVRAHREVAEIVGIPVVSLELVNPHFYHLDTALTVLDDTTVAYYPPAFSADARARLVELFPDAIVVADADANVFGLNAVSDSYHVIHPSAAVGFADQLRAAGFEPIGVDVSELLKGGGAAKCCTLELYS
ncbi:dimethylargininase [Mycobacterium sp. pUA109]|uniref:dimethylargininase n=1 Tax=Mycobacterium sp. pUA109 TaxID=3238982 RepID=UPI00351AB22C